jgi:hypothetical protein
VTRRVYEIGGIKGFYAGAIPNGARLAIKQMYRYPMMARFPNDFKRLLSEDFKQKYPDAVPTATALTSASFETFIICPLERLKVFLMTNDQKGKTLREFFYVNKDQLHTELFRGVGAVYGRQIASWASFLVAQERAKTWEKNRTQTNQLSFSSLMRVSLVVGSINTFANMPFDVAKTALQKFDHLPNEGLLKTVQTVYRAHGVRGLYAGWQARMIQYMIQSAFTVSILDRLERSWIQK